jgi:hypothetical protein
MYEYLHRYDMKDTSKPSPDAWTTSLWDYDPQNYNANAVWHPPPSMQASTSGRSAARSGTPTAMALSQSRRIRGGPTNPAGRTGLVSRPIPAPGLTLGMAQRRSAARGSKRSARTWGSRQVLIAGDPLRVEGSGGVLGRCSGCPHSCRASRGWRDPDSNWGHHDFQ